MTRWSRNVNGGVDFTEEKKQIAQNVIFLITFVIFSFNRKSNFLKEDDVARHWRQNEVFGATHVEVSDRSGFKKNVDNLEKMRCRRTSVFWYAWWIVRESYVSSRSSFCVLTVSICSNKTSFYASSSIMENRRTYGDYFSDSWRTHCHFPYDYRISKSVRWEIAKDDVSCLAHVRRLLTLMKMWSTVLSESSRTCTARIYVRINNLRHWMRREVSKRKTEDHSIERVF